MTVFSHWKRLSRTEKFLILVDAVITAALATVSTLAVVSGSPPDADRYRLASQALTPIAVALLLAIYLLGHKRPG